MFMSDFSSIVSRSKKNAKKKPKRIKKEPYKVPKWFSSLKPGSHGNTPSQKKAWKVVSDYVRERDFKKYGGKCISCDRILERWEDGQAAHYFPWSVLNGLAKYDVNNIALSCAICNYGSGANIGYAFGNELKRRYGDGILSEIASLNKSYRGKKMEEWDLVDFIARLRPDLVQK